MTPEKELKHKAYFKQRQLLESTMHQTAQYFDKSILSLSAGAFAISIAFIRQIIPVGSEMIYSSFLIVAWISFGISILSILFASFTSQKSFRNQIVLLDNEQANIPIKEPNRILTNCASCFTAFLNWSAIFFFVIGVVFLTIFTISNL